MFEIHEITEHWIMCCQAINNYSERVDRVLPDYLERAPIGKNVDIMEQKRCDKLGTRLVSEEIGHSQFRLYRPDVSFHLIALPLLPDPPNRLPFHGPLHLSDF